MNTNDSSNKILPKRVLKPWTADSKSNTFPCFHIAYDANIGITANFLWFVKNSYDQFSKKRYVHLYHAWVSNMLVNLDVDGWAECGIPQ